MCCVSCFLYGYGRFEDVRDAQDALHYLNGTVLHGRELEIQYAEGDRKSEWLVPGYLPTFSVASYCVSVCLGSHSFCVNVIRLRLTARSRSLAPGMMRGREPRGGHGRSPRQCVMPCA